MNKLKTGRGTLREFECRVPCSPFGLIPAKRYFGNFSTSYFYFQTQNNLYLLDVVLLIYYYSKF